MHRLMSKALVLGVVALAVAGCREEEQGRPLTFEPGVYKGEKSQPLSEDQLRALRDRSRMMR